MLQARLPPLTAVLGRASDQNLLEFDQGREGAAATTSTRAKREDLLFLLKDL